jgi:hypothetical protein
MGISSGLLGGKPGEGVYRPIKKKMGQQAKQNKGEREEFTHSSNQTKGENK